MTAVKAIFFDLDHTLWDYEVNSRATLTELFQEYHLSSLLRCTSGDFLQIFESVNADLWDQYNHHKINRETIRENRFRHIFEKFETDNPVLALEISDAYISRCPMKPHLLPHAKETLDYLKRQYPMHILSNGFDDVQAVKLECSGIRSYFGEVITSETSGHRKPAKEIFEYACSRAGLPPEECLMIGDNYHADILGAMNARMLAMYFNPLGHARERIPHFEIKSLQEIRKHL